MPAEKAFSITEIVELLRNYDLANNADYLSSILFLKE